MTDEEKHAALLYGWHTAHPKATIRELIEAADRIGELINNEKKNEHEVV